MALLAMAGVVWAVIVSGEGAVMPVAAEAGAGAGCGMLELLM